MEGPVLILAGAGSGKTRVITHRVAHLVLDRGVPSESILAVTFTNKAAEEMKARAEALVSGRPLRTWLSTFHSFCVRLLRREAAAAGLPSGFLIYDEDDQLASVREAMRALDLSEKLHPPRRLLARISARKNSGRDGEEDDGFAEGVAARVQERYRQILEAAGALDFDDLLLRAGALLERDPAVREAWRRRFPFVLVDEYQDTNRAQYELVRLLAGPGGNLTVVGDEDQSIYSWRGADISNILDFEHDFPGHGSSTSRRTTAPARPSSTWPPPSWPGTSAARARRSARCARGGSRCACTRPRTSSRRRRGWWRGSRPCAAAAGPPCSSA